MGGIDKVMAELDGEPMIVRTVRTFQNCDAIKEIVVVTREDLILPIMRLCANMDKVVAVVCGGSSRQESVQMGLNALSNKVKLVAVQDGARPLITDAVIDRTVRAAHSYGAAAPAIPVKDTIKVVKGGIVKETPDRATLQAVQTPQVFDFDLLRGALKKAAQDGAAVTDDCSAVELMGMSVKIVEGDERNIKVTTPMDLKIAKLLLEEMK
jgi:2-C-methyl-D-erythritol 4-phosphate cytidylyltransferase